MIILLLLQTIVFGFHVCLCCTSFLVTPDASEDGSTFIGSTCDSYSNGFFFSRAQDWPEGTKILGKIPQVNHTYNVVHMVNEMQVSVSETSWQYTRPEQQQQHGAIIFYFDLLWIVLQDIVGKGNFELPKLGAVFVAQRVPNGMVSAHANQARIQKFPLNDPTNCIYHKDTIQFARDRGWYEGPDADFDFTAVYSPISFTGARWCEARVWSMFNNVTTGMEKYLDYAQGKNLGNRLPLWVKPTKKMNLQGVLGVMRDFYQGTWFDMLSDFDVGNQPFGSGYRFGDRVWKDSSGKQYIFERPISYYRTDFTYISQLRKNFPNGLGSILWFSFSDTSLNCYFPIYSTLKSVPIVLSKKKDFSFDSIYWMTKLVSNFAYLGFKFIHPFVAAKQLEMETGYLQNIKEKIDPMALSLYHEKGPEAAYDFLSQESINTCNSFLDEWRNLFIQVFTKFYDGNGVILDISETNHTFSEKY